MEEIIRIKDKRRGVFTVDNVVLNGYGKALGATGIAFYVTLCRYANRDTQQAYPSLTLIRNETGMDRRTILRVAREAEKIGLIKREAIPGKYTIYTLLEPKRLTSSKKLPVGSTGGEMHPTGGNLPTLVENSKRTNEEERMKTTGKALKKLEEKMDDLGIRRITNYV